MNLLVALDALLAEGSVTGAAARLHTSPPAMSRTLGRLRRVFGDPLLVRAGRGLVPTVRALELRDEARDVIGRAQALLNRGAPDLAALTRSFAVQAGDGLLPGLGPALLAAARRDAPGVTFRFLPETLEGTSALRDGRVDLEVGVIEHTDPETRVEQLVTSELMAIVRPGHPLTAGTLTPARYAAAEHVNVSRRGRATGPVDAVLAGLGLTRTVAAVVPSFTAALLMLRDTDLVGLGPTGLARNLLAGLGLTSVPLPLELPPFTLGMAWHPRHDADGAHHWLRDQLRAHLT